jgi:hypothetical protein
MDQPTHPTLHDDPALDEPRFTEALRHLPARV